MQGGEASKMKERDMGGQGGRTGRRWDGEEWSEGEGEGVLGVVVGGLYVDDTSLAQQREKRRSGGSIIVNALRFGRVRRRTRCW